MFYNFISFAGIFVLIGLGWLFSRRRANMNWRAIGFGVAPQLVVGLMVFRIKAGTQVFLWINDGAVKVLETAAEGAKFVFGPLAIPAGQDKSLGFILAFQAFPTIIFFSALIAILGIPVQDVTTASRIIGERLIVTEVTAYSDLATALAQGQFHVPDRSAVITTYALCEFAHLASMAIFVGGVCALAPGRTRDVAKVAVRALTAATLACLMTACVAGAFYTEGSVLFGK